MTQMEIIILSILVLWLVLSILYQFPKIKILFIELNRHHLLPTWTYFAPSPINNDYHILYRNRIKNVTSKWKEISIISKNKSLSAIFNPKKRQKKMLITIYGRIVGESQKLAKKNNNLVEVKELSHKLPFKLAMSLTLNAENNLNNETQQQFMIVKKQGYGINSKAELVFVSNFYFNN